MRLDEYDLKILELLRENSRLSYSDIGKALGMTRQTVKSRIEKLEQEGIIRKYTIEIEISAGKGNEFLAILNDVPDEKDFVEIFRIGKRKYLVRALVEKADELAKLCEKYEFEQIFPVIERRRGNELSKIPLSFRCDYCGKEAFERPLMYKRHNRVYVFCCPTCLDMFRESNYDS
ncbi:winged helix-turn-helix transcriptional regulator [Geoglobus acetivorans]|uniref:Transcriptional regulator, AsnC family n=1 Tax=Geoglobus acetivorans TaxID=565033 RepID=A0A0A7GH71_GEOAI|nr:Transcriptional regulator, AsnC family [Geoglobus acetivorans]